MTLRAELPMQRNRTRIGLAFTAASTDQLVRHGAKDCPYRRRNEIEPERVQIPADDSRAERAGGVHRSAGDWPAKHGLPPDRAANCKCSRLADWSGVGS